MIYNVQYFVKLGYKHYFLYKFLDNSTHLVHNIAFINHQMFETKLINSYLTMIRLLKTDIFFHKKSIQLTIGRKSCISAKYVITCIFILCKYTRCKTEQVG